MWLLISTSGVQLAAAQDGSDVPVTISAEVSGSVIVPSADRLTLTAWRVTVPPGTALRATTLPGPVLIAVEAGELIVGGPRQQWADGSSRLAAGDVATLGSGARIRPRAEEAAPATFLFVSLIPIEPSEDRALAALGALISPMEEDA